MTLSKRQAAEVKERRMRNYTTYKAMLKEGFRKWEIERKLSDREEISPSTVRFDILTVERAQAGSVNE